MIIELFSAVNGPSVVKLKEKTAREVRINNIRFVNNIYHQVYQTESISQHI